MLDFKRINNGNMNDVYILYCNNQKYIFRSSNFDNTFECRILELLEQFQFDSPKLVTNFALNENYTMIYHFIEGSNPTIFDENFFSMLSELLRKLHSIPFSYEKKDYKQNEESIAKIKEYYNVAIHSKYLSSEKEFIDEIYEEIIELDLDKLPKSIIHSDIKEENLIINNDKLSLIDFGNVYVGNRLIDLIRVIMWFFIRYNNYDFDLIHCFISNYLQDDIILTEEEMNNFKLLIKYCVLYNLLKDIYLFENNVLKEEYIEKNSLIWLKALKDNDNLLRIEEEFKNVKRFTKGER